MADQVTIGDYLKAVFSRWGLSLSDAEFSFLMLQQGLNPADDVDSDFNSDKVLYAVIPELLLFPDRTQGDSSIKFDKAGVKAYYAILAGRLGLPNELDGPGPSVTDVSYVW